MKVLTLKKYHDHAPCSFAYKVICINDKFSKPISSIEVKMSHMNLLKQFLKSISTAKK